MALEFMLVLVLG